MQTFIFAFLQFLSFFVKDEWTEKNKELGTPLSQWYARYKVMREREILMEISNKDEVRRMRRENITIIVMCAFNRHSYDKISRNKQPLIERPTQEQKDEEKQELTDLFVNLSDDDESDTEMFDFMPKKKKQKTDQDQEE